MPVAIHLVNMNDSKALYPTHAPNGVFFWGLPPGPRPFDELRTGAGAVPLWKPPEEPYSHTNDGRPLERNGGVFLEEEAR